MNPQQIAAQTGIIPIEGTSSPIRFSISASGCWMAEGRRNESGYVQKRVLKKTTTTHRLSFVHFRGATNGLFVLHKCDTPACCNPDHLFLGTNADNMADMKAKGRRLERRIKFSEDEVRLVKQMRNQGVTYSEIARVVGCSSAQAYGISTGKTRIGAAPEIKVKAMNLGVKVPEEKIKEILSLSRLGMSRSDVAKIIGVSAAHVSNIVNGKIRRGVSREA